MRFGYELFYALIYITKLQIIARISFEEAVFYSNFALLTDQQHSLCYPKVHQHAPHLK